MQKRTRLPRTSRVNEKIMEYYMKFGQERDLEKFMRLYSPSGCCSRSRSNTTTATSSSNNSDEDGRVFRRLFLQETEISDEVITTSDCNMEARERRPNERLIPIRIEDTIERGENTKEETESPPIRGDEAPTTPVQNQRTESKHTQTPESIGKSHKRLEWDSLGDVGYKKSMSTSNISILERSVLKEYFQESSRMVGAGNASEGDLKKLQMELRQEQVYRKCTKSPKHESECSNKYNTPPLASSTMMDAVAAKHVAAKCNNNTGGARPKHISQGTSTSLQKKFEKFAQTSIQRPLPVTTREVQVTLSSTSGTSSVVGSSVTPSSFDYYSSRSSQSQSTGASADGATSGKSVDKHSKEKHVKRQPQSQPPHPFVAGISEMLAHRRALGERNDGVRKQQSNTNSSDMQQLHDTLKQALNENKENSVASSLLRSPQLDLGIQLLCSLIEARSLDKKQKKKLVRDIVKRITRLNFCGELESQGSEEVLGAYALTPSSSSVTSKRLSNSCGTGDKTEATLKSNSAVAMVRATGHSASKDSLNMQALARDLPSALNSLERGNITNENATEDENAAEVENMNGHSEQSLPTTSAKALAKLAAEKAARSQQNENEPDGPGTSCHCNKEVPKLASRNDTNATDSIDKPVQNETETATNRTSSAVAPSYSTSASSSSTKDVTTQKQIAGRVASQSDTDGDVAAQSSMREWLNPMTQSEFEYEEKKREFAKNAEQRERLLKRMNGAKTDNERITQLQWIEKEIERLESLRHLLIGTDKQVSSAESEIHKQSAQDIQNVEKIYDTVCSDKSSQLSESAERLVQEIEVIIEESNEDIVNLTDKLKRSKQRKRETQTVYDKPNSETLTEKYGSLLQGKPRFRTVTETIVTNEEQVSPQTSNAELQQPMCSAVPPPPPPPPPPPLQRSKLQTPPFSNDNESVSSFVQQRKREFMEQYRNLKRNHYESLLQQQQQLLIQQQQQIIQQLQQRPPTMPPTITGHYSVPHTMPRCYPSIPQQSQYYQPYFQHYSLPQQPATAQPTMRSVQTSTAQPQHTKTSRYERKQVRVQTTYSSSAGLTSDHQEQQHENHTSSSSMFCISSEVSVPMGSGETASSTPTTTHQYDDVAAGKSVQTGNSLGRSRAIFGCRCKVSPQWNRYDPQPVGSGQCMCVQVKPKAIAYVIQFDKSNSGDEHSSSEKHSGGSSNVDIAGNVDAAPNGAAVGSGGSSETVSDQPQPQLTLQDHLKRARPEFLAQSKERKAILNRIQALRQQRERELRDILDNASISSLDKRLQHLPPPPIKRLRVFPTRVMKAMTNKRFEKLPEVQEKHQREYEERRRRGNRLLRDVFNRRLQKRVRNGKLSLNHSRQVI